MKYTINVGLSDPYNQEVLYNFDVEVKKAI